MITKSHPHQPSMTERDNTVKARSWATFWGVAFKFMMLGITGMATYLTTMAINDQAWKTKVNDYMATMSEKIENHVEQKALTGIDMKEQELRLVDRINAVYAKLDERNAAQDLAIAALPAKDRYAELQMLLERNTNMLTEAVNFIKVDDERDKRVDSRLEKIEAKVRLSPSTIEPVANKR